ncbi:hypothetical protein ACFX12_019416 [Malus domestica]
MCKVSSFLWFARHYSSPPSMVAAQGGYGDGKVRLWLNFGRKLGVWGWKLRQELELGFLACRMNMEGGSCGKRVK